MATSDLSGELRLLVTQRAGRRCEYCLLPEAVSLHRHEPDHIIPRQHGGASVANNLALACLRCNRHKGPNVGSFDPLTGELTPFFNPRQHHWGEHFRLKQAEIVPMTPEARVTVRILRLNDADRVAERQALLNAGLYP
jgi:5-methylcytosine-specific restriction endonuclease McrA